MTVAGLLVVLALPTPEGVADAALDVLERRVASASLSVADPFPVSVAYAATDEAPGNAQHPSLFERISAWFARILGREQTAHVATPSVIPSSEESKPASADTSTTTTIIYQTINQPVIERVVYGEPVEPVESPIGGGVSEATLTSRLQELASGVNQRIQSAFIGAAQSARVENLSAITVSGVSGLTDADIPDGITASSYLPLAGGTLSGELTITGDFTVNGAQTLSGAITVPYLNATSTTASTFIQASTTRLSVFDTAYFGGSATSTFDSAGNLSISGKLGVGTTSPWAKLSVESDGTGTGKAFAISDSADTTRFVVQDNGNVGVGTSTPAYLLDVDGDFRVGEAGSDNALFVDATNASVGIGIDSPNDPLDISSLIPELRLTDTDGGYAQFSGNGAHLSLRADPGNSVGGTRIEFSVDGTERLRIASSGNVGIGTTSPQTLLGLQGGIGVNSMQLYLAENGNVGVGTSNSTNAVMEVAGKTDGSRSLYVSRDAQSGSSPVVEIRDQSSNTQAQNKASLYVYRGNTGAVGEAYALKVEGENRAGALYASSTIRGLVTQTTELNFVGGSAIDTNGQNVKALTIGGGDFRTGGGGSYVGLNVAPTINQSGTADQNYTALLVNPTETSFLGTDGRLLDVQLGGSTKLLVKNTGNVGIATTTPWRTLSVTGTVGFDGLTGATGAGSLCLDANKQVTYNSGSDACLPSTRDTKHDIASLELDGIAAVLALDPVSFVYNEGDGSTRFGFIAEDTAAVQKPLATYNAVGAVSGIDDRAILSVVVEAIKDLWAKVQSYFTRTEALESEVEVLKARLNELEAKAGIQATVPEVSPQTPTPDEPAQAEPPLQEMPPADEEDEAATPPPSGSAQAEDLKASTASAANESPVDENAEEDPEADITSRLPKTDDPSIVPKNVPQTDVELRDD